MSRMIISRGRSPEDGPRLARVPNNRSLGIRGKLLSAYSLTHFPDVGRRMVDAAPPLPDNRLRTDEVTQGRCVENITWDCVSVSSWRLRSLSVSTAKPDNSTPTK